MLPAVAEAVAGRGWRAFELGGEPCALVWDPQAEFLAFVPPAALMLLAKLACDSHEELQSIVSTLARNR